MTANDAIERLDFGPDSSYNAVEASSHLARYLVAKPFVRGRDVLDVACGQGYGAYLMRREWGARSVHAVDASSEAIRYAEAYFPDDEVTYIAQAAETLLEKFPAPYFDTIVSFETIEHMQDAVEFVRILGQLLKPGGTVIISCPNDYWYYPTPAESNPFHVRKFTLAEFREMTEAVFGPPHDILIGAPLSGFVNVPLASRTLRGDLVAAGMKTLCEMQQSAEVVMLDSDEAVTPDNSSYFVGIWTHDATVYNGSAVMFPCSMTSSMRASNQENVKNLQQEVRSLRTKLFNQERAVRQAGLRAAAFRVEAEYIREQMHRQVRDIEEQHADQVSNLRAEISGLRADLEFARRRPTYVLYRAVRRVVDRLNRMARS